MNERLVHEVSLCLLTLQTGKEAAGREGAGGGTRQGSCRSPGGGVPVDQQLEATPSMVWLCSIMLIAETKHMPPCQTAGCHA
jgi:hypothetical protein